MTPIVLDLGLANPPSEAGFTGDLASLSVFELLQCLHYLRKPGTLELHGEDPRRASETATCLLSEEGLVGAACGDLTGREAVLATLWWPRGQFRFRSHGVSRNGSSVLSLQDLLLDGVRLADEVEGLHAVLPERNAPLSVLSANLAEPLSELHGVPEVMAFLASNPATDRLTLERALPFAPLTLAQAVARLCEEGALVAEKAAPPQDGAANRAASVANAASGNGLRHIRLVLAFPPDETELGMQMVTALRSSFGVDVGGHFFDPTAPSFSRLRLSPDCHLSLTTLPLTRRNRFVFESLLAGLRIAAFVSSSIVEPELQEWMSLIPAQVLSFHASDPHDGAERLLGHVRDLGLQAAPR